MRIIRSRAFCNMRTPDNGKLNNRLMKICEVVFPQNKLSIPPIYRIIVVVVAEFNAKWTDAKKISESAQEGLNEDTQKSGRGRPQKVIPSEVVGRADDYRGVLGAMWDQLWPALSVAATTEDAISAIQGAVPSQRGQFVPYASLILAIVNGKSFPKRRQVELIS